MTQKMKGICKGKASVKIRYPRTNNANEKKKETCDSHVTVFCLLKRKKEKEFGRKRLPRADHKSGFVEFIHYGPD